LVGFGGEQGFIGTTIVAFLGAVVLILAVRALPRRSPI
jgi:uncharacterized membrane protein YeaQ/YmgE (transglycosylase-associated protein family)